MSVRERILRYGLRKQFRNIRRLLRNSEFLRSWLSLGIVNEMKGAIINDQSHRRSLSGKHAGGRKF